jgi:hypothetical protein
MKIIKYDLDKIIPIADEIFTLAFGEKESLKTKTYKKTQRYITLTYSHYFLTIYDNGCISFHDVDCIDDDLIHNLPEILDLILNTQWIDPKEKKPEYDKVIVAKFGDIHESDKVICHCELKSIYINRSDVDQYISSFNCDIYESSDILGWMPADNVVL